MTFKKHTRSWAVDTKARFSELAAELVEIDSDHIELASCQLISLQGSAIDLDRVNLLSLSRLPVGADVLVRSLRIEGPGSVPDAGVEGLLAAVGKEDRPWTLFNPHDTDKVT